MRKLLIGLLLAAAACTARTTEIPVPATATVAGPRPALDAFLNAVRAQDLQALSEAWGDKNGAVRDRKSMPREEMEVRALYLIRCFKHDRYRVVSESPAADSERSLQVELVRGTLTRTTNFLTTKGPDRWYVRSGELEPARDLCTAK